MLLKLYWIFFLLIAPNLLLAQSNKECRLTGLLTVSVSGVQLRTSAQTYELPTLLSLKNHSGQDLHVWGKCRANRVVEIKKFYTIKDRSDFLSKYQAPEVDPAIFGISPYSLRAVEFSKHYQKISESFHPYLESDQVISSLAFESHVVKDVANNLLELEKGLSQAKALQNFKGQGSNPGQVIKEFFKLERGTQITSILYGLSPFMSQAPWEWSWRNLDQIIEELDALHRNMSAMNMHIFSYMTSPNTAIEQFFSQAKEKGTNFNGVVDFEDDHNDLLKEAFYRLFLASQADNIIEKRYYSYQFSILLIAYEQVHAQAYYDNIHRQHRILAGRFFVIDPLGTYDLINKSWALFQVRFSIDTRNTNEKFNLNQVTAEKILRNSREAGTIPHYYFSRIMNPEGSLLLAPPTGWADWSDLITEGLEQSDESYQLLVEYGCTGCHRLGNDGGVVGPSFNNLGLRMTSNEIKEAILNPEASISQHCPSGDCPSGVMPNSYGEILSTEELEKISNYLAQ